MANTALPLSTRISNNGLKIKRVETIKKVKLGDGYEARAAKGINWVSLQIDIKWEVLTYTEFATIQTAIDTIQPDGYFTFTLPNEASARKFRVNSFDYEYFSTYMNASMSLEEVVV